MYYKMKKIPKSIYILIGNRMTNKDPLTKAFNKGYYDGFKDGYEAGKKVYRELTDLKKTIDAAMKKLNDIAKEAEIELEGYYEQRRKEND